jgi:methylated-DNA-protein-cysteine methyltransferase related protein
MLLHFVKHRCCIFVLVSFDARVYHLFLAAPESENMSWNAVYDLVKQIPRGRVLSYGGLAKTLRLPGGARTAGRAMAATPSGKGIPWHRVIGERGKILIREPYASLQKKLLESEGVPVIESRVNFKTHSWAPPRVAARKKAAATVKAKRSSTRTTK